MELLSPSAGLGRLCILSRLGGKEEASGRVHFLVRAGSLSRYTCHTAAEALPTFMLNKDAIFRISFVIRYSSHDLAEKYHFRLSAQFDE